MSNKPGRIPDPTQTRPPLYDGTLLRSRNIQLLYNAIAGSYDTQYKDPIHQAEDEVTNLLLNPYLLTRPTPDTLDLGCGTGWLLSRIPNFPPDRYVGVDISSRMLDVARERNPNHRFMEADILTLTDNDIDHHPDRLILSTYGALSHLPLASWVSTLRRLTIPGNRYFLTLLTPHALTRPSSLASTHPELIPAPLPLAAEVAYALTLNHLPPHQMTGFNSWGDNVPSAQQGNPVDFLTATMLIDALSFGLVQPDARCLLCVAGIRIK